jgi:hypothetical protein
MRVINALIKLLMFIQGELDQGLGTGYTQEAEMRRIVV